MSWGLCSRGRKIDNKHSKLDSILERDMQWIKRWNRVMVEVLVLPEEDIDRIVRVKCIEMFSKGLKSLRALAKW